MWNGKVARLVGILNTVSNLSTDGNAVYASLKLECPLTNMFKSTKLS